MVNIRMSKNAAALCIGAGFAISFGVLAHTVFHHADRTATIWDSIIISIHSANIMIVLGGAVELLTDKLY